MTEGDKEEQKVESFTVEANIGSDKARKESDGQYFSTPLPDQVKKIGLEAGDSVFLSLETDEIEGEEVSFIRGSTDEISRHELTVRHREDFFLNLFVRIPIEYTYYREGQSFYGLGKGDELIVELDYLENEFRVYRADEYMLRVSQLASSNVFPKVKSPSLGNELPMDLMKELVDVYFDLIEFPDVVDVGDSVEITVAANLPDLGSVRLAAKAPGQEDFQEFGYSDDIESDSTVFRAEYCPEVQGAHQIRGSAEFGKRLFSGDLPGMDDGGELQKTKALKTVESAEEYSKVIEVTEIPSRVSTDENFFVEITADLPGLNRVIGQYRRRGEPGFTDHSKFDNLQGMSFATKMPVGFSEPGVYEFKVYAEYRDGSDSSEVRTVEVV